MQILQLVVVAMAVSPDRAFLGVTFFTDWPMNLGLPRKGALVRYVVPNTPAAEAGLFHGDLIVRLDGKPIARDDDAISAWRSASRTKCVALELIRDNDPIHLSCVRPNSRLQVDWSTALAKQSQVAPILTILAPGYAPMVVDLTGPRSSLLRDVPFPADATRICLYDVGGEGEQLSPTCVDPSKFNPATIPPNHSFRMEIARASRETPNNEYFSDNDLSTLRYEGAAPDGAALLIGDHHGERLSLLVPKGATVGRSKARLVKASRKCATFENQNGASQRLCK